MTSKRILTGLITIVSLGSFIYYLFHLTEQKIPVQPKPVRAHIKAANVTSPINIIKTSSVKQYREKSQRKMNRLRRFASQKRERTEQYVKNYKTITVSDCDFDYDVVGFSNSKYKLVNNFFAVPKSVFQKEMGQMVRLQSGMVIFKSLTDLKTTDYENIKLTNVVIDFSQGFAKFGIITGKIFVRLQKQGDIESIVDKYNLKLSSSYPEILFYSVMSKDLNDVNELSILSQQIAKEQFVKSATVEVFDMVVVPN